ncbi:Fe-S cluster assembly scaffold protein SufB (SufB) (PDB:1VH4) [Commensalibacter communis]|uniref:Fe-S cluster assembly scaffold protein SufB (SufB) n=2 Tax=Commensalibacter communis TaxID=2972786 RepID=A0A9W4TMU9_9PROT|nr:Fe-S cluster assembly scaffold protein SufB (SufB) (PDB:1VH4) [Commensalibacter communis]CAI3930145.1 Fe-S cluster assembly scaffold protein SufB (SufB) (PDB:1VH4) [Commensalibacter communis]CAI3931335.1 Fe-S cluster assembly scaffold protein SufB (SufB) (PDB:1VH4) [Commensalibacter communis]CAI3932850.1 Fe-S cluster assembly scaffold protein SufB (SufB) (PDB:1VH4) [Commensalibacter communis]
MVVLLEKLMHKNSEESKDTGLSSLLSRVKGKNTSSEQEKAIRLLSEAGLPSRRVENWKYTDLRWFNQHQFVKPVPVNTQQVQEWLEENVFPLPNLSELPRLIIANGQIIKEFSTLFDDSNCQIDIKDGVYGSLGRLQKDIMTTLNYAIGQQTLQLTISKGQQAGTILFVYLGYGQNDGLVSFHHRLNIELQDHAQLSVIEMNAGCGEYFTNPVCEIKVGPRANFEYNKLLNSSLESYNCANLYVSLADHATYRQFLISKGSKFSRQEVYIDINGEWSNASFQAVQKLADRQHADITTVFSHLVPHCQSDQNVKNILTDQSHGVFQGKVFVHQKAQKTNAQQQNQALLLSDQAEINTKPELEIYADDVKCSHGATVGALDEDQLFFLMARGIPFHQARDILINAFVAQAVEDVNDPIAKQLLKEQLGVEVVEDIT